MAPPLLNRTSVSRKAPAAGAKAARPVAPASAGTAPATLMARFAPVFSVLGPLRKSSAEKATRRAAAAFVAARGGGDRRAADAVRRLEFGDGLEKAHEPRLAADFRQRHDEFRPRLADHAQGGLFHQTSLGKPEYTEQPLSQIAHQVQPQILERAHRGLDELRARHLGGGVPHHVDGVVLEVAEQVLGAVDFAGEDAREKPGERLLARRGEVVHRPSGAPERGGQGGGFRLDLIETPRERAGGESGAGSFRIPPQGVHPLGGIGGRSADSLEAF